MENAAGGKAYPGKADFSQDGTITKVSDGTRDGTGALDGAISKSPKPVTGF